MKPKGSFEIPRRRLCRAAALVMVGWSLALRSGAAPDTKADPPAASAPRAAAVDLRPRFAQWGLGPRQQGARGTCSVFAVTGALEYALATHEGRGQRLSVEYLNWAANQTRRQVRDGGFFSELWDGFARFGICAESDLPYQPAFDTALQPTAEVQSTAKSKLALGLRLHWIKRWNVNTGLSDEELAAIRQTLQRGWPVCGGLRWPKRDIWKNDVLEMCPAAEVFDGHSVLVVGYREAAEQPSGGVLIFRNTNRGGRDGAMPYAYAQAYMNDAVWIEAASNTNGVPPAP